MRRRDVIRGALGVTAGLVVAGCSTSPKAGANGRAEPATSAGGSGSPSPSVAAVPVVLTVSPAAGATGVSPGEPVVVSVTGGKLRAVTVSAGGKEIAGALDADSVTWRSTGSPGYGQTITVTASALDST